MKLKRDENSFQKTNSDAAVKTKMPNATVASAIAAAPKSPVRAPRRPQPGQQRERQQPESGRRQVVGQTNQQPPGDAPGHELGRLAVEDRETDSREQAHGEIGDDDDARDGVASGKEPLERASQRRTPGRKDCKH